jgi:hypothetical protein
VYLQRTINLPPMSEMHVNFRARGILGTVELSSAMLQKGIRAANAVAVVEESGDLMLKIAKFTENEATLIAKQRVATAVPLKRVLSSSSKNNPEVSGLNHGSRGKAWSLVSVASRYCFQDVEPTFRVMDKDSWRHQRRSILYSYHRWSASPLAAIPSGIQGTRPYSGKSPAHD